MSDSPVPDAAAVGSVALGVMPAMLRDILSQALAGLPGVVVLPNDRTGRNLATVLRTQSPAVLILGRPDCDYIGLTPLLEASPATRVVTVSPEGRSLVIYQIGRLPRTVAGLSLAGLLTLLATSPP